jgi:hypothetical protein
MMEAIQSVDHNQHNRFCGHLVLLEVGSVFVNGGRNTVSLTSVFDYTTDQWSLADSMGRGRWDSTTVFLLDGSVFAAIGNGVVEPGEDCDGSVWCTACSFDAPGIACSDGDACTDIDQGIDQGDGAGVCAAGTPVVCGDGLFCGGAELCDALTGCARLRCWRTVAPIRVTAAMNWPRSWCTHRTRCL